eukprot:Skav214623  [mRNA]  locus=scaffold961:110433:111475:+ [translate_table: standard]
MKMQSRFRIDPANVLAQYLDGNGCTSGSIQPSLIAELTSGCTEGHGRRCPPRGSCGRQYNERDRSLQRQSCLCLSQWEEACLNLRSIGR